MNRPSDPISDAQRRAIHAAAREARLDDEARRDVISSVSGGKRSTLDLTAEEADAAIARLNSLAARPGDRAPKRRAADTVTGRYAAVLRALWLSAWNLGLVRNRDDKALIAFVERQTRISHTRFLTDGADAAKAIEALKGWMARDAGVEWPSSRDPADRRGAVIAAQLRILDRVDSQMIAFGDDEHIRALGREIRNKNAQAKRRAA